MLKKLVNHHFAIPVIGLVLLIPALLINLGKLNIFMAVDEATRGLVALEMMIRGNYITPTINGEFYYNKPPLFNWILIVFFKVFGISEFSQRLPGVISLVGMGLSIYYFVGKELGRRIGIITAFAFVTSGRILFWESLLGYIDITFAWVVYLGIMFTIKLLREKKFLQLFVVSYLFMTLGYFLKGLPAIVFQGITLLVTFIAEKQFRMLFNWRHLAGGSVFLVISGIYYLAYNQYNSLDVLFRSIWNESVHRTPLQESNLFKYKHLILFPFEMSYHYFPWSVLLVLLFRRGFWKMVFKNTFLKLNLFVFFFNLLPYWTSPDVFPKYIMMLVPLIFTVAVYNFFEQEAGIRPLVIEIVFLTVTGLLIAGLIIIPFLPQFYVTEHVVFKSVILIMVMIFLMYLMVRFKAQRLVLFVLVLVISRFALDWFVWPQRASTYQQFESDAIQVARITGKEPVNYYGAPMLQYGASYVISKEKWDVVGQERNDPKPNIFYITDNTGLEKIRRKFGIPKIYFTYPNVEDGRDLHLLKISPPER